MRLEIGGQHDHEDDDEHVRHARPVGQGGDVACGPPAGELTGEVAVEQVAERQRDAQRGQDAPEHHVRRQVHDAEAEAGQHDHVQQHVGEQSEESVPVARTPKGEHRRCPS